MTTSSTGTYSAGKGVARGIRRQVTGRPAVDGAGVRLVRVLGTPTVTDFDPFLMLDAFDSVNPEDYTRGFPMHPHRGIETVTYLVEGTLEHKDSLGNQGLIKSGGAQWMTAGSGILHQEMPQASPRMLGLQLWINLPKAQKMTSPKYHDLTLDMLPFVKEQGVSVGVLAGDYKGQAGAMHADYVEATFLDVNLEPGATWTLDVNPDDTLFAYLMSGQCEVGHPGAATDKEASSETTLSARHAVLFTPGDSLTLIGGEKPTRMVIVAGAPLKEPVAWGGPIVMNTDEELKQAFFELENGTFIK